MRASTAWGTAARLTLGQEVLSYGSRPSLPIVSEALGFRHLAPLASFLYHVLLEHQRPPWQGTPSQANQPHANQTQFLHLL